MKKVVETIRKSTVLQQLHLQLLEPHLESYFHLRVSSAVIA